MAAYGVEALGWMSVDRRAVPFGEVTPTGPSVKVAINGMNVLLVSPRDHIRTVASSLAIARPSRIAVASTARSRHSLTALAGFRALGCGGCVGL